MKCSKCGTSMKRGQKSCTACGKDYIFKLNKGTATSLPVLTALLAVTTIVIVLAITLNMDRDQYSVANVASEVSF